MSLVAASSILGSSAYGNARGKELYRNCSICHGTDGEGIATQLAPSIAGLSEPYLVEQLKKFKDEVRGAHPDDIAGARMFPMGKTLKTEEDMQALAEYIAAMPTKKKEATLEGGDPKKGEAIYRVQTSELLAEYSNQFYSPVPDSNARMNPNMCSNCHGQNGEGNDLLKSPALTNQYDWYLLKQLENFKKGVRAGADSGDANGGQMMGPMMMHFNKGDGTVDKQAMLDVIAFLQSISN